MTNITFYKPTKYKQTAIGQVPEEWDIKPLNKIANFFSGLWKGKNPPFVLVNVIRNTNFLKNGKLDYSDVVQIEVEENQFKNRKLKKDDIILERSGGGPNQPVGRVVLFDRDSDDFSLSNFTTAIRIKDEFRETIKPLFLYNFLHYYYISGNTDTMQSQTTGIRNLDFQRYKRIEIFIPKVGEQQKISEVLSKIDEVIETVNVGIERWQKIKKAAMRQLLTRGIGHKKFKYVKGVGEIPEEWNIDNLKNITLNILTGSTPLRSEDDYWIDGDIPWLTNEEVSDGIINFITNTKNHVTKKALKKTNLSLIPENSVILSLTASVGKVAINKIPLTTNQQFNSFVVDKGKAVPEYLAYRFLFDKERIMSLSGKTTFKFISKGKISNFEIPLPSLPEQQKIAGILQKIDEVIETKKQKKKHLERAKKEMMRLLLTGKVRIKV